MADKIELTDGQVANVLTKFVGGATTSNIVDDLLFELELEDNPENRKNAREFVRPINPHDSRFAWSKYGALYELVRDTVMEEFRIKGREVANNMVDSILRGIDDLDTIGKSLNGLLEHASDNHITSNSEYLNTVKTLVSLQKLKIEGVNAVTNLIDALTKMPDAPSESE